MAINFSEKITFLTSKKTGKPFTPEQKLEIIKVIQDAYDLSPTYDSLPEKRMNRDNAIDMLEYWITPPPQGLGRKILIQFKENDFAASTNEKDKGLISIDPDYAKKGSYIGVNGTAIRSTFKDALIHELGHALRYYQDDWENYAGKPNLENPTNIRDYSGGNVTYINRIYKELGIPLQLSYPAADYTEKIIKPGYEYTNGTKIDAALALGTKELPKKTFWDSTPLGNSNDLLIGSPSSDTLKSGSGNDFLFGGLGNDLLDGGTGSDTGVYYGLRKNYFITQVANGDWTVQGLTGLGKTAGKDTLKNIEFLQFDDPDPLRPGKKKAWALDATFIKDIKREKSIAFVFDTTRNLLLPSLPDFLANPFPTIVSSLDNSKILAASILDAVFADPDNDIEIGIVGFNDTTIGNSSQIALSFTDQTDFTDRKAAALEAIDNLTASDGGDIAETPFDGLLLALDELQWRDGGTHQIFLFTDAPAKDYALADQVTALARNIGSTIASTATTALAGGALSTFNLVSPSLDETTDLYTTQVQIFTIFTGAADADTIALAAISNDNDGALLTGSTNDRLLQQILATFNPPPVNESFNQIPRNDFNGDGNSDILWRNIDGSVAIWSLDGNAATPQFVDSVSLDWTIAGTGDFNGDLSEDILWRNDNGAVALWTMNDSIVTTSSVLGTVGTDWKIVGTGDFNGDSESDILWRNDDGRIALWQMNDSIVTTSDVLGTVSLDWNIVGTGDFNNDGESDILWRNDNGTIALWQINDLAYTTGAVIGTVTSDWKIAGSSDFNGDGSSDILWRNDNGTVALWQINDLAYTSGDVIATESNDWTIAETGDFNGDGRSDILWRNDNGSVATWQMDGTSVVSASLTSIPSADLAWKIAAPIV
jgi:FG-GAP-like repeat/RTX calcium-binding nonapeptide repeat (4 copies)